MIKLRKFRNNIFEERWLLYVKEETEEICSEVKERYRLMISKRTF